jgi:hypothetical protein
MASDIPFPRHNVGEPKRCRCQVTGNAHDHCHQQADGEDMRCPWCRAICVGSPDYFTINMADEGIACNKDSCPPWGDHSILSHALVVAQADGVRFTFEVKPMI